MVADDVAADDPANGASQLGCRDDLVRAQAAGLALLVGVAGADDHGRLRHVADEPGDRGEAHRAGAEHRDDRLVGGDGGGLEGGVDAAGERLDEHGSLVGHVVADAVQLAVVGDELR